MVDFARLLDRPAPEPLPPAPDDFLPFPPGWEALAPVRGSEWFRELARALPEARAAGNVVPAPGLELEALRLCPLERVRVVILGPEPHAGDAADGLAWSCPPGVAIPSTCREIARLLREHAPSDAVGLDLRPWAESGALLLNAALTTTRGWHAEPPHRALWEPLTRAILGLVAARDEERHRARALRWDREEGDAGVPPPAVFVALGRRASWAVDPVMGGVWVPQEALVSGPHPRDDSFPASRLFERVDAHLAGVGAPPFPWRLPSAREQLFEAARSAWRLPPAEGRVVLEAALARAEAMGYGSVCPAEPGTPSSRLTPEERRGACERAEMNLMRRAYARVREAESALKDAGRLLRLPLTATPPGNVSREGDPQ